MRKAALLMLCTGVVAGTPTQAAPVNGGGYPGQSTYGTPAGNSDGAIFEVLGRLEQLQSEVQQLRGLVEEQAQTITDLERKQGNMYSDLDDRIQALTTAAGASAGQSATAQPQPAPSTAGTSAATPVAGAVSTPAPAPAATAAPAQSVPAQPPVTPAPVVENKPTAAAPSSASGNEKERYQQAYDTLRNGHNAQAVNMFEGLLADFPAGEFADNAQYWLAEAHKINRDYDKARAAFSRVVSQYPNSSKVPDALLKLGYIESDLQNQAKARDYLTRVVTSYPGTTAAHLASKKLAQMPQ